MSRGESGADSGRESGRESGAESGPEHRADVSRPVLFVTGHVPPDRVGAFACLHELEGIELALFGGRSKHGPPELAGTWAAELDVPHAHVRQSQCGRLAAGGGYRAVVCSTGGRVALPATWAGARRARLPLLLWAALWAHPRSVAHVLSYAGLRRLYRSADAVVTYGPHVSRYVAARGARNVHVAPQSVDNDFWRAPVAGEPGVAGWPREAAVKFVFAGRAAPEKGLSTLLAAWSRSGLRPPAAALILVGGGSSAAAGDFAADGRDRVPADGVVRLDAVAPSVLREIYAGVDGLVVPSIPTATFREPWGLVVNEAMNRALPVIASDAVGAVAGGLVRDGRNGLVVAAGDSDGLARALVSLAHDGELRARLGAAGAADVGAYNHAAWARGFSEALATVGLSRAHC